MKILLYSPKDNSISEEMFFSNMESAMQIGADMIVFPEKFISPYDELLCGADILNPDETDYVLSSLYDFSLVSGLSAIFSATDDFGISYSLYANGEPYEGETYSKLYIKHTESERPAEKIDGYEEFGSELFEPIVLLGQKIGILTGNDMLSEALIQKYIINGTKIIINPTDNSCTLDEKSRIDISKSKNTVILSVGFNGNVSCFSPKRELLKGEGIGENLYLFDIDNRDFN